MTRDLEKQFEQIANGLSEAGFAVIDEFLTLTEVTSILDGDEFKNNKLHFKKAGVGKGPGQIMKEVRGDYIQWIDPATATQALSIYLHRLRQLIPYLNQTLYLSLRDFEIHLTLYPAGSFYKRHIDQFKSDDHRKISIICYLNSDWKEEQGGELKIYLPDGPVQILPLAGRLVCFRSDMIEHEVLPATRDRLSITGWITDRPY